MSTKVESYERAFLGVGAALLVVFMGVLVYSALVMHLGVVSAAGRIDVARLHQTPPFDAPGVHRTGANSYDVVIIGQAWSFTPAEIRVPAGAEIRFRATSADVIHGFLVEGTRVNMMLIPGQVSETTYRFRRPGNYLLICHEYCGLGHQTMYGRVIVQ